ncbi:F0F1 ATP synthase subunit delta [Kineosporia sp. NBRC 101731]|uniref:F0F1 ATP synthase subunit delta n=1 Tax=Kineosporia sp. NBRC 101731 TaxID=3032199 RepID=UPI0024A47436|nr:F0F1 ATP synthase subunit delta [Kineosporia sp. NBRC 101731]GLY28010.1 ATP synthase subunit delta [Kineosporia sp. NBRC 101731]
MAAQVRMQGPSRVALAAGQDRLELLLSSAGTDAARLAEDLFGVTNLVASNAALRRALTESSREADNRAALVARLLEGKVSGPAQDLVSGLVRSHWSNSADLTEALEGLAVSAELYSAEKAGRLDNVEDELFRFGRTVAGDVSLRDAFAIRTPGGERKRELVNALLSSKVAPETLRLAEQAATAPRGRRVEQVLEKFLEAAAARRRQLVAEVVAASPLTEGQRARLSTALRRLYGRDIRVNLDVDPEVMGGLRIMVAGELIDSTVLSRLNTAKRTIAG